MPAQLYVWTSRAIQNYGPGRLVAVAEDADTARARLRAVALDYHRTTHRPWDYDHDGQLLTVDDGADRDEWLAQLEADIAIEPMSADVLFVPGSDLNRKERP